MDQSNVINLGLFLLTGVGLLITLRQARLAATSKRDADAAAARAETARDQAVEALTDISNSSARSAAATEGIDTSNADQAASLRLIAARPAPWTMKRILRLSSWELRNSSTSAVITHSIRASNPDESEWFETQDCDPKDMVWSPGEMEIVNHTGADGIVAPAVIKFEIAYNYTDEPDEPHRFWHGTVS